MAIKYNKFFFKILLFFVCGCSSNQNASNQRAATEMVDNSFAKKPLIIEKEEGWGADIQLSFTEYSTTDTTLVYGINSNYDGKDIGFILIIPKKGFGKLTIKSKGKSSDNFLQAIRNIYKYPADTSKIADSINADCLSLAELNRPGETGVVLAAQKKLFFQGADEEDYAELFLNINEQKHCVELKEKDPEYRPVIIKLLTRN